MTVILEDRLDWRAVAAVAEGASLSLSPAALTRVETASRIVEAILARGLPAYGITTGVGALSETVVDPGSQARLSRAIVLSHACGVGPALPVPEVRAIMAAQVNNFAHGHSGVRPVVVETLCALLAGGVTPVVPSKGSVGYLTHNAHIALVLIGEGKAELGGQILDGRTALAAMGREPLVLRAKEGLSLVNGSACATGLACLALARAERLIDWTDAVAALTLEAAGAQMNALSVEVLALRVSPGMTESGRLLRARLEGSPRIAAAKGRRTQDALSLRAIPHAHGAARDLFEAVAVTVERELASVTDNPAVSGTPDHPVVSSEAHAVAPALALAADSLALAVSQLTIIAERRLDRLVNPLVSGLPPFLATDPGSHSGFMIAQYTAAGLAAENRRLAAPASSDGGITSGLQEDFLAHPTAAATKLLTMVDNAKLVLAIEFLAAVQAGDLQGGGRATATQALADHLRATVPLYADDRPLSPDIEAAKAIFDTAPPPSV